MVQSTYSPKNMAAPILPAITFEPLVGCCWCRLMLSGRTTTTTLLPAVKPSRMPQEISPSSVRTVAVPFPSSSGHLAGHLIGRTDKVGDEFGFRLQIDIPRRALLNDHAGVHHGDDVGHRQRFDLIVGDVESRDAQAALQLAQLEAHALAQFGIEITERLVQEQHLRLAHQRAGQREPLLLPAGELRGHAIFVAVQFHLRQRRC